MTTARILDSGKQRRIADLVPEPLVASCLMSDSAGCIIVTIERPSQDRLFAHPLYVCAPRAFGHLPSRVLMLYRDDDRIQGNSPKNRPVLVRLGFWRSTPVSAVSDPHAIIVAEIIRRALQHSTSKAPGTCNVT